jgi:hypothetical protein
MDNPNTDNQEFTVYLIIVEILYGKHFHFRSRKMDAGGRRLTPMVKKCYTNRKVPESSKQGIHFRAISPLSTVHTRAQSVPSDLSRKPWLIRTR